jgi:hypothetical protein
MVAAAACSVKVATFEQTKLEADNTIVLSTWKHFQVFKIGSGSLTLSLTLTLSLSHSHSHAHTQTLNYHPKSQFPSYRQLPNIGYAIASSLKLVAIASCAARTAIYSCCCSSVIMDIENVCVLGWSFLGLLGAVVTLLLCCWMECVMLPRLVNGQKMKNSWSNWWLDGENTSSGS